MAAASAIAASAASAIAASAVTAADADRNKTVIGYPAPPNHFVTGYPSIRPPPTSRVATVATFYISDPYFPDRQPAPIFHRVIFAILSVILIMIASFLLFWMLLRPRLPEFQLTSASISSLHATSPSSINSTWNLSILVTNPNQKLTISYDRLEAAIVYDNFVLFRTEFPPFIQPKASRTILRANLTLTDANVGKNIVGVIMMDRARGSVVFGVRLLSLVRFRTGRWWFRRHFMSVYCQGMYIGFSPINPNGTLLNPNKQCAIAL